MPHFRTTSALTATVIACALALTGCTSSDPTPAAEQPAPTTAEAFPRTLEVPGARGAAPSTVTIDAAPQSIAALDYESAEVLAELGLSDTLVLVPEAVTNPALGGHIAEMAKVPTTIPVAMQLDAETVLALQPDLVVMSPRHGAEDTIGRVLADAGTPTLQLPGSWTDLPQVKSNISLIGEATGTEDAATELTDDLSAGLKQSTTPNDARVLVLSNQAGRPFITAGNAFPIRLLELTGATSVSEELGITTTGPISAEQIVEANPDAILLVDMNGSGERLFAELLANPAVAALDGAQNTQLVTGREVQALGLTATIAGLDTLNDWLASE